MRKLSKNKFVIVAFLLMFVCSSQAYGQPAAVPEPMPEGGKPVSLTGPGGAGVGSSSIPVETLNPYNLIIPEKLGKVEEVFQGLPGSPVIVHIQDAHANYEAQVNIKNILAHLSKNYNMNLIQLEGASSQMNPAIFETAYLKEANQKLADYLMREGRLSGAEAFAIESEKAVELHGIENRMLYMENLRTFRAVYSHQAEITDYFNTLRTLAKDVRLKLLNEELLDLTRNMEAYATEKIDLIDYLVYLDGLADKHKLASLKKLTEITRFPNLVRIMRLHELEKQLDERQVKKEAEAIREAFSKKTSDSEVTEFLSSLELKKKGMKPRAYFKKVSALAERYGIDLLGYPQMRAMSEFLILQDEIEHRGLFTEVHRLERMVQKELFKTKDERHLIQLLRSMELLDQYFKLEVNREKLAFIVRHYDTMKASYLKDELDALAKKLGIMPSDYQGDVMKLDQIMDDVEYFYRVVLERDRLFVENVMAKTKDTGTDRTVLITGGFHTDGLTALLKKQNVSYLVVIPKVDVKQGTEKYVKIMTEGDSEVGSVFAGTFALGLKLLADLNTALMNGDLNWYVRMPALGAGIAFQKMGESGQLTEEVIVQQREALDKINALLPFLKASLPDKRPDYDATTNTVTFNMVFRLNDKGRNYEMEYQAKVSADNYELTPVKVTQVPDKKAAAWNLVNPATLPGNELPQGRALNTDISMNDILRQLRAAATPDTETAAADPGEAFVFPGVFVLNDAFPEEVLPILLGLQNNPSAVNRVAEAVRSGEAISREMLEGIQALTQPALKISQTDIDEALPDDSQRALQVSVLSGLNQGDRTRVVVLPVQDEAQVSRANTAAQIISLAETLRANRGAAAVVIGHDVEHVLAASLGVDETALRKDPALSRIQFIEVAPKEDVLDAAVDVVKRQGAVAKAFSKLPAEFKGMTITELYRKGYVRVITPKDAEVDGTLLAKALNRIAPGVLQFESQLLDPKVTSNPNAAYAYATIEVKGANIVPAEGEEAEFAQLLKESGLDQYIIRNDDGSWAITNVQALVENLVKDFLAAREIAIRA